MSSVMLAPQGVYETVQSEGHLSGQTMTFIRLAGCSVGCEMCDTDYKFERKAEVHDVVAEVEAKTSESIRDRWAWLSGGEPADQNIAPLVRMLKRKGFSVAVATSGTKKITVPVDWLSVSPHGQRTSWLTIRAGNEIKLVPGLNGLDAGTWIAENDATIDFWLRYLQPMDGDPDGMAKCLELHSRYPHWGLSLQAHKIWGLG